jgi:hypothetical protein
MYILLDVVTIMMIAIDSCERKECVHGLHFIFCPTNTPVPNAVSAFYFEIAEAHFCKEVYH